MSGLWTPHGEHRPEETPAEPAQSLPGQGATLSPEDEAAAREQLRQLRAQLAQTPVADIIANHVIGLWELAVLHLTEDEDHPPNLEEARLAIDTIGAIVEGLGDRLGEHAQPLRDALAQLRLAFVQMSRDGEPAS